MPKIPLYARGQGSAVELATGRLGPAAPTGAFEAPGQALVRAGEAVGRVGTQFAKNAAEFQNAKNKLEFDFQMKQKQEQTRTLSKQFETEIFNESQDYIRTNTETDPFKAADTLKTQVYDPLIQRIDTLDLTDSQKTAIKASVNNKFAYQSADIKKSAHNLGTIQGGQTTNDTLEAGLGEAGTVSEISDLFGIVSRGKSDIREGTLAGQRGIAYSEKTFQKEAYLRFFSNGIANSDSVATLQKQRELIGSVPNMAESTKKTLEGLIAGREADIKANLRDDILGSILTGDLDESQMESAAAQLRTRGATEIRIEGKEGEDDLVIPFGGAGFDFLTSLANTLDRGIDDLQNEKNRSLIEEVSPTIVGMNRDQLETLVSDAQSASGQFEGASLTTRGVLERLAQDRLNTMDRELSSTIDSQKEALGNILIANKGIITENAAELIDQIGANIDIVSDENEQIGIDFDNFVNGIAMGGQVFSGIKFKSAADGNSAILQLREELKGADANEAAVLQTAIDSLTKMEADRQAQITNDPVKFIQTNRAPGQAPATTSELVTIQEGLGIAPVDIRVASDQQISTFQDQFRNPELTSREKSELGIQFITQFGVEHEGRVMRNLMNKGVLTLADTWIIANPDNAAGFDIDAANRPDIVKTLKAELGNTTVREIMDEVRVQNSEYTGSVIGGMSDTLISRGATGSRMLHITAMNGLIQNTAMYYMQDGKTTVSEAVEKAIDNVVNTQFAFGEVNGKPLRMLKGFEGQAAPISELLTRHVKSEPLREYITSIAEIPPLAGQSDEAARLQFMKDLSQGYWVTTSDHKGAYLVDQTGNMVPRKVPRDPLAVAGKVTAIRPDRAFITVRFEDLIPVIEETSQIRQLDQRRRAENRLRLFD
jgi:hypothetical protein